VLVLVPMFHANAWGFPYTCTFMGSKQVLPGPHLHTPQLAEILSRERVTQCWAVPTVWLNMLQHIDRNPAVYDLSHLRVLGTGGQAMPEEAVRRYYEEFGITMATGWGMTETGPFSTEGPLIEAIEDEQGGASTRRLTTCGRPLPLTEFRVRAGDELAPWDGRTTGELEVRGATVASSYFRDENSSQKFSADGWLRTGDIASLDPHGDLEIHDRARDAIKSGGEWISSIALENALMAHPAVAEAAVVAAEHPTWLERPVAVVALKEGANVSEEELRTSLVPQFARWWLPDAFVFVPEIPKTSTGKFLKSELRDRYRDLLKAQDIR
jgi:fatty-acyl-CoA synthase